MPSKQSKNSSDRSAVVANSLASEFNTNQAELLAHFPWLNERYLLPGEEASDHDARLQLLAESIVVKDALHTILVKDIHDELREVQRMRVLRQ